MERLLLSAQAGDFRTRLGEHITGFTSGAGNLVADVVWAALQIAVIYALARAALWAVSRATTRVMHSERYHRDPAQGKRTDTVMTLIRSMSRYVIYGAALLAALSAVGAGGVVGNLLVTAGIGSVAIGFGAQSLVKDVVTGMFLMFENQFSVGDYVKIDGQEGTVTATAMRVTYLSSSKGEQIIIPNGNISQVINYTRGGACTAQVKVRLPFDADPDTALEAVRQAVERRCADDESTLEPPLVWGISDFDQYGYTITASVKTKPMAQWACERGLRREILAELRVRGLAPASVEGLSRERPGAAAAEEAVQEETV